MVPVDPGALVTYPHEYRDTSQYGFELKPSTLGMNAASLFIRRVLKVITDPTSKATAPMAMICASVSFTLKLCQAYTHTGQHGYRSRLAVILCKLK